MARRAVKHPVTTHLPTGNERLMAEHWGTEAITAIRAAIRTPNPTTKEDLELEYAVRATRMAVWHATKVRRKRG